MDRNFFILTCLVKSPRKSQETVECYLNIKNGKWASIVYSRLKSSYKIQNGQINGKMTCIIDQFNGHKLELPKGLKGAAIISAEPMTF